jgi:hypothetical protein
MAKKRQHSPSQEGLYLETFDQWLDSYSEEDERNLDALEVVETALQDADVDAKRRKIIWQDGRRLSITQSAQRIHAAHPELLLDLIESKVVSWLDMCFAPETYSEQQLDELDRLTEKWIEDHQATVEKRSRTPDS